MEGRVVVLLRTSSVARAPVYAHLRSLGLALLVVHPFHPADEFDGVFNWWLEHDTHDARALEPVLRQFVSDHGLTNRIAAIVSFDEYAVYPAALLATRWYLQPVPLPPEQLRHVNIKSDFRAWCHTHGVNAPRYVTLRRPAPQPSSPASPETKADGAHACLLSSLAAQLAPLTFPIILKPSPGAGSLLAKVCHSVEEAAAHAQVMWTALHGHPDERHFAALRRSYSAQGWSSSSSLSSSSLDTENAPESGSRGDFAPAVEVLAEEYVRGHEVDMDCAIEHGRLVFCSISDNFETKLPFCAEEGGTCPSSLPEPAQLALRDLLDAFIAAHGRALHGVLHFEAKYDPSRQMAFVIEVNCRMGSAETNYMLATAYRGLQLGEALVRCAMAAPLTPWIARYYPELAPPSTSSAAPELLEHKEGKAIDHIETLAEKEGLSASSSTSSPGPESKETSVAPRVDLVAVRVDEACAASPPPPAPVVLTTTSQMPSSCSGAFLCSSRSTPTLDGVLPCERLGGPARGYYPACAVGASVNLYPEATGVLRHVAAPLSDARLVACSISAKPGDFVAPPPGRFYLLCWMVARGDSIAEAVKNIHDLTDAFEQHVEPVS